MTRRRDILLTAVLISAGLGSSAPAQIETKSNAPVDITANEAEVVNLKCLSIWRGAAEAMQGDTRLRADVITLYDVVKGVGADGQQACGAAQKVVADGHVYYVTPTQNARADHAVYTSADDLIVLTGDVIVVQGKNVARGDRLVIKVSAKQSTMESNTTGAGQPNRVRGVFYPDKQAGDDASKTAAANPGP